MEQRNSGYAMNRQSLMNQFDDLHTAQSNMAFSSAGLAIGTTSKKTVKIANTVTFLSNGVFKSKTTAEVPFTATAHDIPANASAAQSAIFLLTLAADGTPTLTKGDIASAPVVATIPERPATGTPIGYVKVSVAAGATPFDATTDDLDAAHLTCTYVNLGFLAPRFDAAQ